MAEQNSRKSNHSDYSVDLLKSLKGREDMVEFIRLLLSLSEEHQMRIIDAVSALITLTDNVVG